MGGRGGGFPFKRSSIVLDIFIGINYLIKIQYIIPIDLINATLVAKYFIKYVFKVYKLSKIGRAHV